MKYTKQSPQEFLGDLANSNNPTQAELEAFETEISKLLQTNPKETEEHHKNKINDFLKSTFKYDVNTKGKIDAAIYVDGEVAVIIEVKALSAPADAFPKTPENLESKAFYESILYYLRESKKEKNNNIKHIILCTLKEFFIISAKEYENLFGSDKTLNKFFKNTDFKEGNNTSTQKFYDDTQKYLEEKEGEITYTCFDFSNISKEDLALIYKLLSPACLLKQKTFFDANLLNKDFYNELLHILGLEEKTADGKIIITPSDIQGSLSDSIIKNLGLNKERDFEDIFSLLTTWNNRILFLRLLESMLLSFKHISNPFLDIQKIPDFEMLSILFFDVLAKKEDERKNIPQVFQSIPYLNSSLFDKTELEKDEKKEDPNKQIKFLKSQDLSLHKNSILKKDPEYKNISSLPLLEYLFAFLRAYDFTTTPKDIKNHTKTNFDKLINAAVLGLVFEKLNGYKEGSFYTPSFITNYMCKEAIEKVVIDKFNAMKSWQCESITDLCNHIGANTDDIKEANEIFNSIKICDPAVGSGHFLVSALNHLILIKYQLGILCDENYAKLKGIGLKLINDEICIIDSDGEPIIYEQPVYEDKESHRIQKAIFNAKKVLIEECLFGVDINPNSCEITKLRLWIELLKYSYYHDIKNKYLQTLPNIDINIKCGNSLVSNINLYMTKESLRKKMVEEFNKITSVFGDQDQKEIINDLTNNFNPKIKEYVQAVQNYKNETNKDLKEEHKRVIRNCQEFLITLFKKAHSIAFTFKEELKRYVKKYGYEGFSVSEKCKVSEQDLQRLQKFITDFDFHKTAVIPPLGQNKGTSHKDLEKLQDLMCQYRELFETKTLEWRFAFPEVLDENGDYIGFDLVIGNPPYIRQESIKELKPHLQAHFEIYSGTSDIFTYFYEQGYRVLKEGGHLSYITSNKWTRAGYGKSLRKFILEKTKLESYVELGKVKVFDSATVDTSIVSFKKVHKHCDYDFKYLDLLTKPANAEEISALKAQYLNIDSLSEATFTFSDKLTLSIKKKIESIGIPLKDWDIKIYRGILTGYNEAFIIDTAKREEILSLCDNTQDSNLPFKKKGEHFIKCEEDKNDKEIIWLNEKERTEQIIRPILRGRDIKRYSYEWAEKWVIATFPSLKLNIDDYLSLKNYLKNFMPKIKQSGEKGCRKKTSNQWFETQDNIAYWSEFYRQKIVYPETSYGVYFVYDTQSIFLDKTSFMLISNNIDLKFINAFLNSKAITFYFKEFCGGCILGGKGFQYNKHALEKLVIPPVADFKQQVFIKIVDKILDSKKQDLKANIQDLEAKIDCLVYELYGLNAEEIAFIENHSL
ncbi:hypothetical protein BKH41_01515 [Helicobacter sp. 12S02232-10]|uniref:type IIG restriction enzyme/methyltransferase n=1 Tax=Helicobacter sp. 12S02232-10 TaxID=1476197 RepID=UPI000BA607D7|nr:Eco57I restriction-modification methylase domain-containing protein [Helicobacter sp. 12S02232-10]PAF50001.1 hypothetical protein BKH41_01515 [Helicobacter sp. 12S02232-10]